MSRPDPRTLNPSSPSIMELAFEQAEKAAKRGEVPVGAVLVSAAGEVLACAGNRTEMDSDPTAHAEMLVLREGARLRGSPRLMDCDLYVTLEPCAMCAAAISFARILKDGDIVGLDFGVSYEGWYGDSARTVAVGKISPEAQQLIDVTKESLRLGIEQCREGNRVFDIGHAVQNYVERFGYGVVREFVGHGIGRALHEEPQVPNYGPKGKGLILKAGMVLAIEPMINAGSHEVRVLSDGWTAVTQDRSLSAHFEHTVAITPSGPVVLTVAG